MSHVELFKKKKEEKLIYLCSFFQQHQLWKGMSIICVWLWNPVLRTTQKRQSFYIGTYVSEMWMERCRLNWYISCPLWLLPPLQSQSGSYRNQMWQISFSRCQKFHGLVVKLKTSLDYSFNTEQAFHLILSYRKHGLKASLISWNKTSNYWTNIHCRHKNT